MKKIIRIIKKIFLIIGTFLLTIYTKVLAVDVFQPMYGVPLEPDLYGVPRPNEIPMLWKIAKGFIVPLAFIIGMIIYFKKSSSPKFKKIITVVIMLAIVILICFGINYIIING